MENVAIERSKLKRQQNWIDSTAIRKTFSVRVVMQSVIVTVVVGTLLNIINQGEAIIKGEPVDFLKITLTYAVPFFVASYGAYAAFSRAAPFGSEGKDGLNNEAVDGSP